MLQTQLVSWEKTEKNTAAKSRQRVLDIIRANLQGCTLFELVKLMGIPVNSISGRITELKKEKLIYNFEGEIRLNPETRKAGTVWKARNL